MVDFRSALYLGMHHPHAALPAWEQLSLGMPAALEPPPGMVPLARSLAELTGCEAAMAVTSSLHLFWDLFAVLAHEPIAIYRESSLYPTALWGVERVAVRGIKLRVFGQHHLAELAAWLHRDRGLGVKPVIVADGLLPSSGKAAPLSAYLDLARGRGGYVVIDDTQALGILGHNPCHSNPYGLGGGGTAVWHGAGGPELILASSLAKGFGVPLAMLAGSRAIVEQFAALASTQVHCSPPSVAVINAARLALTQNARQGDPLRRRLLLNVREFQRCLNRIGLVATSGVFPMQTLQPMLGLDMVRLHDCLWRLGIKSVLHGTHGAKEPRISFLLTAAHVQADIQEVEWALRKALPLAARRYAA